MAATAARSIHRLLIACSALLLAVGLLAAPAAAQDTGQDGRDEESTTPARVAGQSRVETAAEIARLTFEQADTAHLVRVDDYPDALAASFGAGVVGGPVLLTPRETVGVGGPSTPTSPTVQAVQDLGVQRVVLVGGESAIDESVARELRDAGYDVDRIEGVQRYDTSSSVAMRYGTEVRVGELEGDRTALMASGEGFADALAAGPVAAGAGLPLLLTPPHATEISVNAALEELEIDRIVIVGGTAAVAPEVVDYYQAHGYEVERWAGPTRTATAAVVADNAIQRLGFDATLTLLARGDDFADALAASAHGGVNTAPLLLTADPDTLSRDTLQWLDSACPAVDTIRAIGGTAAVGEDVLTAAVQAAEACHEPGGQTCTSPEDGYTVTHPFTWTTNGEYIDQVPPCSMFDPDPTTFRTEGDEVPGDLGAYVFVDSVPFEDVSGPGRYEEVISQRDATVDGRRAERIETRTTEGGFYPEGTLTTRWAVDLDGQTLIAVSRNLGQPDYAQKVDVLDQMMASLAV